MIILGLKELCTSPVYKIKRYEETFYRTIVNVGQNILYVIEAEQDEQGNVMYSIDKVDNSGVSWKYLLGFEFNNEMEFFVGISEILNEYTDNEREAKDFVAKSLDAVYNYIKANQGIDLPFQKIALELGIPLMTVKCAVPRLKVNNRVTFEKTFSKGRAGTRTCSCIYKVVEA